MTSPREPGVGDKVRVKEEYRVPGTMPTGIPQVEIV